MSNNTNTTSLVGRRAASRNRQYASTLVHYLGVQEALKTCERNMWRSVRTAIEEQFCNASRRLAG